MRERLEPRFDPEAALQAIPEELPEIETPVIDLQELDLDALPEMKIDEAVSEALAELERSLKKQAG